MRKKEYLGYSIYNKVGRKRWLKRQDGLEADNGKIRILLKVRRNE